MLAALRRAAARGEEWTGAWDDLLWSEARGNDSQRFRCLLARRLAELPDSVLAANLRGAVQWFTSHSRPVWEGDRGLYLATWQLLCGAVERHPEAATSAVVISGGHDWITEAINSPSGCLADIIFKELAWTKGPQPPDASMKNRIARLLGVASGARAYVAARVAMRANLLSAHDSGWTEAYLLPLIENVDDADVAEAAQTGFLCQSEFPTDGNFSPP